MIAILVSGEISKELFKEIMELTQKYLTKIKDFREAVSRLLLYLIGFTI